jgi:hypothetical protein
MIDISFKWNPAKAVTMNNKTSEPIDDLNDDLRPEYHFDYSKAKPNRFAVQTSTIEEASPTSIQLDPDIAAIFPTTASVNNALRLLVRLRATTQELDSIVGR